jgi:hypothetical protein
LTDLAAWVLDLVPTLEVEVFSFADFRPFGVTAVAFG